MATACSILADKEIARECQGSQPPPGHGRWSRVCLALATVRWSAEYPGLEASLFVRVREGQAPQEGTPPSHA